MVCSTQFSHFFLVKCFLSLLAAVKAGPALRHREQSAVVLSRISDEAADVDAAPALVNPDSSGEIKLVSSMESVLEDEKEAVNSQSAKATLRKKLASLIWLERVLQKSLDSMDEDAYKAKIAQGSANLRKDNSSATSDMLNAMRTEMHNFSVPFYRSAAEDELKRLQYRQNFYMDKLIALDAGQKVDVTEEPPPFEEGDEPAKVPGVAAEKPHKQEKKRKDKATGEDPEERAKQKAAEKWQEKLYIFLMSSVAAGLLLIIVGTAIKVRMTVSSAES